MRNDFRERTGQDYSQQQLQSKLAYLKTDYTMWETLCNNSGFGWDADHRLPTAPPDVWESFINAHPKSARFRHETLYRDQDMETMFKGKVATGIMATAPGVPLPAPVPVTNGLPPILSGGGRGRSLTPVFGGGDSIARRYESLDGAAESVSPV